MSERNALTEETEMDNKTINKVVVVKNFLSRGAAIPLTNQDYMAFWRGLTEQEKTDYALQAIRLNGETPVYSV